MDALASINFYTAGDKRASGRTNDDIASELGITRVTFERKLNGKNEFKLSEMLLMCDLFGTDPNHLLGIKPNQR